MKNEATYPYRVQFAEEGPTLQQRIEMLLRDRMKEANAEWPIRR